jgi:hypothetical protein
MSVPQSVHQLVSQLVSLSFLYPALALEPSLVLEPSLAVSNGTGAFFGLTPCLFGASALSLAFSGTFWRYRALRSSSAQSLWLSAISGTIRLAALALTFIFIFFISFLFLFFTPRPFGCSAALALSNALPLCHFSALGRCAARCFTALVFSCARRVQQLWRWEALALSGNCAYQGSASPTLIRLGAQLPQYVTQGSALSANQPPWRSIARTLGHSASLALTYMQHFHPCMH